MSRYKYLLYVALALAVVLVVAFGLQLKKLQKQVRSSVRIIPADSKARADVAQNGLDQNGSAARPRPQILVKFRAGVSTETISQITARFNDQIADEIEAVPGLTAIQDQDNADAEAAAAQYQALTEVEYAEPNYEINVEQDNAGKITASNDPEIREQWALQNTSLPQAWAKTRGSREIVVAVLDTGVEYTHVALVNNIWTRPANIKPYQDQDLGTIDDVHGYNAVGNDGDPLDDNGHGTACAGIIGAECDNNTGVCGVNAKTQIMSLKFLNGGGFGDVAGAVAAINYAIDRKRAGVNLRVINASWGLRQPSRALADVIRAAADAGILFVAAGGDTNTNNDTTPRYPVGDRSGNIISVAAIDSRDALAEFSNYGSKTVQLAAPGKDILTTALGNDYKRRSGTSPAAAFVSGIAALALSAHPDLSVAQLRSRLLQSVDQRPELRGRVVTGGRINAARAVSQ